MSEVMKMTAPMEVGVACLDLDKQQQFYVDVLGMKVISKYVISAEMAATTALSCESYTVIRLQTPWGERIKLLHSDITQPVADSPKFILERANTIYLTFIVDNLEQMMQKLSDNGIVFSTGTQKVEVRPGVYLAFCEDPEGNILEFVQYADIREYRSDLML